VKYFFSYGDDKYKLSKERINFEAKQFGFDKVNVYGPEDLEQDFISKTHPFISHPRGGGYWLWKPYFLKKTFDMMNDGDICVYADAGCTINPNGLDRFEEYLSTMKKEGTGILRFVFGGCKEEIFTNNKVFEFFGKDEDISFIESDHLMATILIFEKNENSTAFVDKYYQITCTNPEIFSDDFNGYNPRPNYKDHRHDQSVSSCLVKFYKFSTIDDETYCTPEVVKMNIQPGSMEAWRYLYYENKIPFLATRIRN
jgi:hypothetical protein